MIWSQEIGYVEPAVAASSLRHLRGFAFLDSSLPNAGLGRYSYLAAEPFGTFTIRDGIAAWNGMPTAVPPMRRLRELLAECANPREAGLPPFQGGSIGWMSYDFGWQLVQPGTRPEFAGGCATPLDGFFGFFDCVLAFDQTDRRAFIMSSGLPQKGAIRREQRARMRIAETLRHLAQPQKPQPVAVVAPLEWFSNFSRDSYAAAVDRVREYIYAGDIYQANISQQFSARLPPNFSHWRFYQTLRATNPATFAAFLRCGELTIASSSPERFVRLDGARVEARPIKGTIRRSALPREDFALAAKLQASAKDRAENVMIVDLLRNDISRVCLPHSVEVPVLCGLESYAGVHHLVSQVTGTLAPGHDVLDVVAAAFPGGSITGAPKLRAMQIIAEIEGVARGPYCGIIGWTGFDGSMDANIAIRTVVFEGDTAKFNAGGGITCLSESEAEYDETLVKARRIFDAFAAMNLKAAS